MKKLRFAQAGVSLMHANMYRDTLMLLPDELELVGFYDPDPEGVKANLKADVQGVPFYDSLADLLSAGQARCGDGIHVLEGYALVDGAGGRGRRACLG